MLFQYGRLVAISKDGTTVVAGANNLINMTCNAFATGGAYVHHLTDGKWIQQGQTLEGHASGNSMNISVSINANGTIIAVGVYFGDPPGVECCNVGYAQVFQFINSGIGGGGAGASYGWCGWRKRLMRQGYIKQSWSSQLSLSPIKHWKQLVCL
jgi:hypothetical protein